MSWSVSVRIAEVMLDRIWESKIGRLLGPVDDAVDVDVDADADETADRIDVQWCLIRGMSS